MAKQSREIYQTGMAPVDIILQRIAARLDVIEGLRPDIGAGNLAITTGAGFEIADVSGFQEIVSGVTITDNSIAISSGTLTFSDGSTMTFTGGSITLNGSSLRIDESNITFYDENNAIIHKLS